MRWINWHHNSHPILYLRNSRRDRRFISWKCPCSVNEFQLVYTKWEWSATVCGSLVRNVFSYSTKVSGGRIELKFSVRKSLTKPFWRCTRLYCLNRVSNLIQENRRGNNCSLTTEDHTLPCRDSYAIQSSIFAESHLTVIHGRVIRYLI